MHNISYYISDNKAAISLDSATKITLEFIPLEQKASMTFTMIDGVVKNISCWQGDIYNMKKALERASQEAWLNIAQKSTLPLNFTRKVYIHGNSINEQEQTSPYLNITEISMISTVLGVLEGHPKQAA